MRVGLERGDAVKVTPLPDRSKKRARVDWGNNEDKGVIFL